MANTPDSLEELDARYQRILEERDLLSKKKQDALVRKMAISQAAKDKEMERMQKFFSQELAATEKEWKDKWETDRRDLISLRQGEHMKLAETAGQQNAKLSAEAAELLIKDESSQELILSLQREVARLTASLRDEKNMGEATLTETENQYEVEIRLLTRSQEAALKIEAEKASTAARKLERLTLHADYVDNQLKERDHQIESLKDRLADSNRNLKEAHQARASLEQVLENERAQNKAKDLELDKTKAETASLETYRFSLFEQAKILKTEKDHAEKSLQQVSLELKDVSSELVARAMGKRDHANIV